MKINDYYRDAANLNLNGSIAALLPIVFIAIGNLAIFQNKEILVLTVPFFLYSFICFQLYLFRKRQSISINRNMSYRMMENSEQSIFSSRHLLVLYLNSQMPKLLLYHPDGHLAGSIKRYRSKGMRRMGLAKSFVLYNSNNKAIGCFAVKGKKVINIEVYDNGRNYLGSLVKTKLNWRKSKEELLDRDGKYIGAVEGSNVFMDEKVINQHNQQVSRLRRGWMPVEWDPLFPEPNTPVLSFDRNLSAQEKLLGMSFLINEYFIER